MTGKVNITANCPEDTEVAILLTEGDIKNTTVLEDGDEFELCIYGDRVINLELNIRNK